MEQMGTNADHHLDMHCAHLVKWAFWDPCITHHLARLVIFRLMVDFKF